MAACTAGPGTRCSALGGELSGSVCVPSGSPCPSGFGVNYAGGLDAPSCAGATCCVPCSAPYELYQGTCVRSNVAACMRAGGTCITGSNIPPPMCPTGTVQATNLDCFVASSDQRWCCLPAPDGGAPEAGADASSEGG